MGYSYGQIKKKVDEIIDFADIGDFIHQPVKNYSSGMFSRLSFAIAINTDPDILIIDEVLAVGDFNFRFKCHQKINKFKNEGKSIILVSHSNQDIIENCNKALYLENGNLQMLSSNVQKVIFEYERSTRNSQINELKKSSTQQINSNLNDWNTKANKKTNEFRFGSHQAIIQKITLSNNINQDNDQEIFQSGSKIYMKIWVNSKINVSYAAIGLDLRDEKNIVNWADNNILAGTKISLRPGINLVTYEFNLNLTAGEYFLCTGLADLSGNQRIELDQRWMNKKITVISDRVMAGGYVYSPITAKINYISNKNTQ